MLRSLGIFILSHHDWLEAVSSLTIIKGKFPFKPIKLLIIFRSCNLNNFFLDRRVRVGSSTSHHFNPLSLGCIYLLQLSNLQLLPSDHQPGAVEICVPHN